ncbi:MULTISPECIES: hypothetical protein [unclassified Variovorax]|uniref:hypothetical protein n=1 Tax=unclassified Variovorax TaxID=663243 RepID=UPI002578A67F|nr:MULTISPECIES: hypothetical protein [unclassified Variovorax]MDM0091160.1 hypothetical protein [Variovorax sp. J22G40]MDM0148838.1 hypothetical protein [Variovorax sp. J2P1-31]
MTLLGTLSRLTGLLCLLATASVAPAAELKHEGNRLLVIGQLDAETLPAFSEQLASGKVRTVVFEDAFGGTAEAAGAYAAAIRSSGVQTEVRGQCQAACAYAFLAAKSHRFGSGLQINGLLLPVAARPTAEEMATRWRGDDTHRTLAEFTAPAPSASTPLVETGGSAPRENWRADHGVLFTSSPTLFGRVYNTFYCDGTQGRDFSKCELLSGADPYQLGVLTN